MKKLRGQLCLFAVFFAALAGLCLDAQAQDPTMPAVFGAGTAVAPQWQTNVEQYNAFNGTLSLAVPLHHIGGRGEGGFDLVYSLQPNWVATYKGAPNIAFLFAEPYPSGASGYSNGGLGAAGAVYVRTGYQWVECSNGSYAPTATVTTVIFEMPNFRQLTLFDTASGGAVVDTPAKYCTTTMPSAWGSRGTTFLSNDRSQVRFTANSNVQEQSPNTSGYGEVTVNGTLTFPNGVMYTVTNSQITKIEDRNGNVTTLTYGGATYYADWYLPLTGVTKIVDSMNRATSISYNANRYRPHLTCAQPLAFCLRRRRDLSTRPRVARWQDGTCWRYHRCPHLYEFSNQDFRISNPVSECDFGCRGSQCGELLYSLRCCGIAGVGLLSAPRRYPIQGLSADVTFNLAEPIDATDRDVSHCEAARFSGLLALSLLSKICASFRNQGFTCEKAEVGNGSYAVTECKTLTMAIDIVLARLPTQNQGLTTYELRVWATRYLLRNVRLSLVHPVAISPSADDVEQWNAFKAALSNALKEIFPGFQCVADIPSA